MKFITVSAATFSSLMALASAEATVGVPFGLLTIRSGSVLQYSSLSVDSTHNVRAGAADGDHITGEFTEDHKIKVSQCLYLASVNGKLTVNTAGSQWNTDSSDHLVLVGEQNGFQAQPAADHNGFFVTVYNATTATPEDISVAIRVAYRASNSAAVANSTTEVGSGAGKAGAISPWNSTVSTSVLGAPSQVSNTTVTRPTITSIEQVSHGFAVGANMGLAVAAIAGALLI